MSQADGSSAATVVAAARSAATYVTLVLYVLALGTPGLVLAFLFNWPGVLYRLGLVGVRLGLVVAGIRIRAAGLEHVQLSRPAVYCVNHTSNVEPPILFLLLRRLFPKLRILYKAVLRRLPVLGRAFDIAGFVPIERGNRGQSLPAIDAAAQALREGNSFLIFPEGTRSRTGDLLPFKKGGFVMAIKAQVPMVPIAITGAGAAMKKGSPIVWPVTVTVRLGPPIETAGLGHADRDDLIRQVRAQIAGMLAGGS